MQLLRHGWLEAWFAGFLAFGCTSDSITLDKLEPHAFGPAGVMLVNDQLWVPDAGTDTTSYLDARQGWIEVASMPGDSEDIAYDGNGFWLTTPWWTRPVVLTRFLPDGIADRTVAIDETVPPFEGGLEPLSIAWDGFRGGLWLASLTVQGRRLTLLDPETGAVLVDLPLPSDIEEPYGLDLEDSGEHLWVADRNEIHRLSLPEGTLVASYRVVNPGTRLRGLDWIGPGRLWLVDAGRRGRRDDLLRVQL